MTVIRDTYVTHLVGLDVKTIVVGQVQVIPVYEVLDEDRIILLIRVLLENEKAWDQAQHLTRVLLENRVIAEDMVVIGREQDGRILIIQREKFDSFRTRG